MPVPSRHVVLPFVFACCTPLAAQALELRARGGSLPGPLVFEVAPASFPFQPIVVVPSSTPGPTACSVFDPLDPRSLDVGLELVDFAWAGLADLDLELTIPTALANAPALQDLPMWLQAVTIGFQPTLIDSISNGTVVRLGLANSFRDRSVFFAGPRAFATVLPRLDGRLLLVGGAQGTLLAQMATSTTEVYDPYFDIFFPGPPLSTPRSLHTATQLPNGRWLICGGVDAINDPQPTCELYDPLLDTFVPAASMGLPRMGHTATLLPDGRVLVTGGLEALTVTPSQLSAIRDATPTTELYDPATDTWSPGPNLTTPRAAHAAMLRPDGRVLLAGGISWDPSLLFGWLPAVRASCDVFNPATNTIAAGPAMATARSLVDPVDLGNGRFLMAGGINGLSIFPFNPGNPTAQAEIYDAVANAWTTVAPLQTPRANHRAWPIGNGRFLLAGGANNSILTPSPLASTEVFSLANNAFTPGPAMTSPRAGAAAFLAPQGQMMLFGGSSVGNSIVQSTEWYYY